MIVLLWAHRDASLSPARFLSELRLRAGAHLPCCQVDHHRQHRDVVATLIYQPIIIYLGLIPRRVVTEGWLWQLGTYMFLHGGPVHILFNMLGIWMFGTELERLWGTKFFSRFYAITGIGAGLTVVAVGLLPFEATAIHLRLSDHRGVGRAVRSPDGVRDVLPGTSDPDVSALPGTGQVFRHDPRRPGVPDLARAARSRMPRTSGGFVFGYLYLRGGRGGMTAEIKYRYLKWKMNRLRRKFDVYSGGRSDWDSHVH